MQANAISKKGTLNHLTLLKGFLTKWIKKDSWFKKFQRPSSRVHVRFVRGLCFRFTPVVFVYICNRNNVTRWLEDLNFMIEWKKQDLTRLLCVLMRYCFCHSNIKFIFSRHRVLFSIYWARKNAITVYYFGCWSTRCVTQNGTLMTVSVRLKCSKCAVFYKVLNVLLLVDYIEIRAKLHKVRQKSGSNIRLYYFLLNNKGEIWKCCSNSN